ncbi:MAG: SRPBCC domain-containing protein [Saprospiraceae bacterium]|nr:SRPBCC domain-containing protein [Saprospiraceae bacterium]
MNSHGIYHDLTIASSPQQVFHAVSQPDHLINWWPLACTGEPALGKVYNLFFGPEYDWVGKVSTLEPNKVFRIRMVKSDPDWDETSFGFKLMTLENQSTKVQFEHTGWPHLNDHFRTASFCWAMLLLGLKEYVEDGKIIPFESRS